MMMPRLFLLRAHVTLCSLSLVVKARQRLLIFAVNEACYECNALGDSDHLVKFFFFTATLEVRIIHRTYGEMAEWLKAPVLKTGIR